MPWYYEADRQQRGPVTDDEFNRLVQTGAVRAETLVWREGMAGWVPYSQVAGGAAGAGVAGAAGGGALDPDTAVCAVSGRRLPKRDMLEFEGRWVSAEHKEEFFQRLREGVTQPGEMVYAGFWIRFAAKFIDGVFLWIINMIIGVGGAALIGALLATQQGGDGAALAFVAIQVFVQVAGILAALAYSIFFIRKWDATPGKRILGLKVLRADGSSLSKGRIVGRYFAEWISGIILLIGYLMAAFDKEERRALHDRICDTRVIKG
jgi:uncharacterized RDD family membrane protein YckC